jgi:hypothetical protein
MPVKMLGRLEYWSIGVLGRKEETQVFILELI